jgi:hypothetical protein
MIQDLKRSTQIIVYNTVDPKVYKFFFLITFLLKTFRNFKRSKFFPLWDKRSNSRRSIRGIKESNHCNPRTSIRNHGYQELSHNFQRVRPVIYHLFPRRLEKTKGLPNQNEKTQNTVKSVVISREVAVRVTESIIWSNFESLHRVMYSSMSRHGTEIGSGVERHVSTLERDRKLKVHIGMPKPGLDNHLELSCHL